MSVIISYIRYSLVQGCRRSSEDSLLIAWPCHKKLELGDRQMRVKWHLSQSSDLEAEDAIIAESNIKHKYMYSALQSITSHNIALQCNAVHFIAMHRNALHSVTSHLIAWHCIALHFIAVFHLALSNMAQRYVAFCERHVALHKRHVALLECHVALHVRHVALLIFRQWNASLNCCYVIFNPPRPLWLWKTPQSLVPRAHTYDAIPDNDLCAQW